MEQIFHGQFSLYDAAIFRATLSAQIGHGMTEKGFVKYNQAFLFGYLFA